MANTKTRNQGNDLKEEPENLVSAIRARIAPLDGVDLELPPRLPGREPPSFEKGGILAALRRSPLVGADLELSRPRVEGRKFEL